MQNTIKTKTTNMMPVILLIIVAAMTGCSKNSAGPVKTEEPSIFSILRGHWTNSSKPADISGSAAAGKMIWYNPFTLIATGDIWEGEASNGDAGTQTLMLEFSPPDSYISGILWAGIIQSIDNRKFPLYNGKNTAPVANDDYAIELRTHGEEGILHIDLGNISEDVNGNGTLDTEDKIDPVTGFADGIIDSGEDTGIDGLNDQQEAGYDEQNNPDPAGDNWWYNGYGIQCEDCTINSDDFRFINGTEGNALDPDKMGKPDTEDIDGDGILDTQNDYFSYEIDLSGAEYVVNTSEFNGWKTFRIPLPNAVNASGVGSPSWDNINYVRIWLESDNNSSISIGIAQFDIVAAD